MGTFVRHIACEKCGSSDGNAEYDDGTTYCFSCLSYGGSSIHQEDEVTDGKLLERHSRLLQGSYTDIPKRHLREDTCRKFGYQTGTDASGEPIHIANYCDASGRVVAQKTRRANKLFAWMGERGSCLPLYGQHLWTAGKSIVITEGEIDCLSVAQAFGLKYAVVSLPDGAQSAPKAISKAYEWLCGFDKIVLCFDQDEPGQKAAQQVAEMLPVGKVFIMRLQRKDANEVLVNDGPAPITAAFWNAQEWRPDGIISGKEFNKENLKSAIVYGYSLPWPVVNERLYGIREGELTLLTAGSGIGKSTLAREMAFHLHKQHGLTIGNIFLEEATTTTAQAYVALDNNVPLHELRKDPSRLSDAQWDKSIHGVLHDRMYFYDHFGSLESDRLLSKIRYMRSALKCNFVVLDHISIVVSGMTSSGEGERRDIDVLMTKLRSLIQETGLGVIAIVHLRQPDGKPHEEGGRVTLRDMRGSGSLKQLADSVWALERNQQDPENKDKSVIRILKDRYSGNVGEADQLLYNCQGRMVSQGAFVGTK